jgi:hypothetical protein
MTKADVNGDGLEDVFVGGGARQPGTIFIQTSQRFTEKPSDTFNKDKACDDVDAAFFDANNDGFPDLYVCSGGYHDFLPEDSVLQDRLYLNDGKGGFRKPDQGLPEMLVSSRCVAANDINEDGFQDLFVGGFVIPGRYPEIPNSAILLNDQQGNFRIATPEFSDELEKIGMVTDAVWHDLDNDSSKELIIVGQWMPVKIYGLSSGRMIDRSSDFFNREYSGFWNTIHINDFNNDGKADLILGNLGLNSQLQTSEKEPADLYFKDFDNNGSVDPILCFYIQGKSYPYVTRKELISQIRLMESRFPTFESYADATIRDVFTQQELKDAGHLQANHAATTYFESNMNGKFIEKELPLEVQYAPVYTITSLDYNYDGNTDLLLCGNINHARIRFGKYDANYGLLLEGDGSGGFKTISQYRSGFSLRGDVRSVLMMEKILLFGINQKDVVAYRLRDREIIP